MRKILFALLVSLAAAAAAPIHLSADCCVSGAACCTDGVCCRK
jgi:hypothetical protein